MIKRQLAQDPNLKDEDWSRFIPNFASKNVQRKKPKIKNKKPYTPFPPSRTETKVDQQVAEGKYFIDQENKKAEKKRKYNDVDKNSEYAEKQKQKLEKRNAPYIAPAEDPYKPKK